MRLAIPNIVSNLSIPLMGTVDTAIVGHLEGYQHLGAVAIGGMIFNFIYWGLGFLRMGTTGITAQYYGSQKQEAATLTLMRAGLLALLSAAFLLICRHWIADFSFYLLEASDNVENLGRQYFDIRLWAAPAALLLYAMNGWFFGLQNASFPLVITVTGNILNIGISLYFVKILGMKSDGVAWGTVVAQYLSLLLGLGLLLWYYRKRLFIPRLAQLLLAAPLNRFFSVNFDIFIRTLCLVFAFTYFTAQSATFGDAVLGANTLLMQFWTFIAYGMDGFAFAAESLVGRYVGAGDEPGLKRIVRRIFVWSLTIGALWSLFYAIFSRQLLGLLTNQPALIELAMIYVVWTIIAPLINSVCFIWDGVFIGATDGRALRNAMIFCTFVVFLPVYWLLKPAMQNNALWIAMTVFMVFRGITLTWYAWRRLPGWVAEAQG